MTRRSRRELEDAVDRLGGGDAEYPTAGLITLLSTSHNDGTVELLDRERRVVSVDGEPHRITPTALKQLTWGRSGR